jgi:hypothetical protein
MPERALWQWAISNVHDLKWAVGLSVPERDRLVENILDVLYELKYRRDQLPLFPEDHSSSK